MLKDGEDQHGLQTMNLKNLGPNRDVASLSSASMFFIDFMLFLSEELCLK